MNWRGRPLTSHEVIVQTIAATTTGTGLSVHAALDTGSYPTGVQICDADMTTLPLSRHAWHGEWNYVLHPRLAGPGPVSAAEPEPIGEWDQDRLSDPALTGMPRQHLQDLTAALAGLQTIPRDGRTGRPPVLPFSEQVLAAVLHLHLGLPVEPLAVLFDSTKTTMRRTLGKILHLLDEHGTVIPPAASPPAALAALHAYLLAQSSKPTPKIKPAC
jgi:hypothetical protein